MQAPCHLFNFDNLLLINELIDGSRVVGVDINYSEMQENELLDKLMGGVARRVSTLPQSGPKTAPR